MTRNGGSMADPGSVSYLFSRKGVVIVPKGAAAPRTTSSTAVLDAGAEEVNDLGEASRSSASRATWSPCAPRCRRPGIDYESAEASFVPSMQRRGSTRTPPRKVFRLIDALEDSDDVQNVFANVDVTDEVMAAVELTPPPEPPSRPSRAGRHAASTASSRRASPDRLWTPEGSARRRCESGGVALVIRTPVRTPKEVDCMRVLGVDPGLTRCGVGVVDGAPGDRSRSCTSTSCAPRPTPTSRRRLLGHRAGRRRVARRPCGPTPSPSSGSSASTTSARSWARRRPAAIAIAAAARRGHPGRAAHPERGQGGGHRQRPRRQGPGRRDGDPAARARRGARSRPTPPTPWRWPSATCGAATPARLAAARPRRHVPRSRARACRRAAAPGRRVAVGGAR